MGDISKNFSRSEFACECGCGFATVDVELVHLLERIRHSFDSPITINSGCRCLEYNEKIQHSVNENYVSYSSRSKHMLGIAADIVVNGVDPLIVYQRLTKVYNNKYGLGKYNTFTHIDVRLHKARWG